MSLGERDPHTGYPQIYVPFAQEPSAAAYLLLRPQSSAGAPAKPIDLLPENTTTGLEYQTDMVSSKAEPIRVFNNTVLDGPVVGSRIGCCKLVQLKKRSLTGTNIRCRSMIIGLPSSAKRLQRNPLPWPNAHPAPDVSCRELRYSLKQPVPMAGKCFEACRITRGSMGNGSFISPSKCR